MQFDGQQTDERVLCELRPHPISKILALSQVITLSVLFAFILWIIGGSLPSIVGVFRLISVLVLILFLVLGVGWTLWVYRVAATYITDRRIMRFELVSPVYTSKRALFWHEAMKAKAYSTNILWRILNVGTVVVEPEAIEAESVRTYNVFLFEDVANYIDKILYAAKKNPTEISTMKPFIAKAKGKRDV